LSTDRYSRQSFLGLDAEEIISKCTVGIVGLGGGGSHIVQQLAHIGFQRYILYDYDIVEESNLNRLIGAKELDVLAETPKLHIAKMMIYGLQSKAHVRAFSSKWQDNPEPLRECQIIFGCVDTYKARQELEIACRRYLMHYIDIGMDIHGKEKPVIGGQVILSSPGGLCMKCMGFLTDEKLAMETALYGNAGSHPQVVWPNGVLASTAVGLAVDIVTNWTRTCQPYVYLVYDGNKATVFESYTLKNIDKKRCPHFSDEDVGDPCFIKL
jgi:molybdopterin-synthase adenylyltransferase